MITYTNGSGSFPFHKDVFITIDNTINIAGMLKEIGAVFNSQAPGLTPVFCLYIPRKHVFTKFKKPSITCTKK